jgi:hypothetical protein
MEYLVFTLRLILKIIGASIMLFAWVCAGYVFYESFRMAYHVSLWGVLLNFICYPVAVIYWLVKTWGTLYTAAFFAWAIGHYLGAMVFAFGCDPDER